MALLREFVKNVLHFRRIGDKLPSPRFMEFFGLQQVLSVKIHHGGAIRIRLKLSHHVTSDFELRTIVSPTLMTADELGHFIGNDKEAVVCVEHAHLVPDIDEKVKPIEQNRGDTQQEPPLGKQSQAQAR